MDLLKNMKQELIFKKGEQEFAAPIKISEAFSFDDNTEVPDMFKDIELEKGRYFWGYANIATPDTDGDKFSLDALTEISRTLTFPPYNKIFLFHNYQDIAIGKIVATMMDGLGMIIVGKINEAHERADETYESIQNGSLDGFSMAGNIIKVISEYDESTGGFINLVIEATAKEVTLTSIPVHPGATVMGTFRKSMEKRGVDFSKAFQGGKIVDAKKSDNYKKDVDSKKDMVDDDSKKADDAANDANDDSNNSDDSNDANNSDDSNDSKNDANADDAKAGDDDKNEDSKDSDDVDAAADKAAKDISDGKKDDDSADDDSKNDDSKDDDKKKKPTADEKLAEADKRISELEKEIEELNAKLSNYEKAVKKGYKKAMNDQKGKTGVPFRKSKKTPDDKKLDSTSGDSNSTPMLNWLKKKN